jgi:SAM-dependent methyltransferase
MPRDERAPHESLIYGEFSHLYDVTFGRVFYDRIVRVIRALAIPVGAEVLEVGVGTGLTLDAYPSHCHVTGVDLAEDMLAKARRRVAEHGWSHVTLRQADALNLDFPDASFDYVMAFHVVSVVPDARRMMAEMPRVPAGRRDHGDQPLSQYDSVGGASAARRGPAVSADGLDHARAGGAARGRWRRGGSRVEDLAAVAVHDHPGAPQGDGSTWSLPRPGRGASVTLRALSARGRRRPRPRG